MEPPSARGVQARGLLARRCRAEGAGAEGAGAGIRAGRRGLGGDGVMGEAHAARKGSAAAQHGTGIAVPEERRRGVARERASRCRRERRRGAAGAVQGGGGRCVSQVTSWLLGRRTPRGTRGLTEITSVPTGAPGTEHGSQTSQLVRMT